MENPQNFTAEEVGMDGDEIEEMKMEMGQSENDEESKSGVMMVVGSGGYNRDKPPEDDCCPICFDEFRFPCRTSCGHWFCASCILLLWRYSANFKPCKCPICGCLIINLVLESSTLIQPGEDVGKILEEIQQYNRLRIGGWSGLFMKAVIVPLLISRRWRDYVNPMNISVILKSMHFIGLVLCLLYEVYEFDFFPHGGLGIVLLFDIGGHALLLFVIWDVIWHRWIIRRGARHLADLQQME